MTALNESHLFISYAVEDAALARWLSEGNMPKKPYKEIASFTERGNPEDESKFHGQFAKRAKKMGADGLILKPGQAGGSSFGPFGGGTFYIFRGIVFVYE